MNTLSKDALRAQAKAARAALSAAERARRSEALCRRLSALPPLWEARTILSYCAVGAEVNLQPLHKALQRAGKRLCFPMVLGEGVMEGCLPAPPEGFCAGPFGIPKPQGASVAPEDIDLILAPCLAFDARGTRLGMGGGYYDRYLARCPRALVIAVGFECQRVERLPREIFDRPVSAAVTEDGVYCFAAGVWN